MLVNVTLIFMICFSHAMLWRRTWSGVGWEIWFSCGLPEVVSASHIHTHTPVRPLKAEGFCIGRNLPARAHP
ncbi:hypothetical protein, partial [Streptomyces sanglieri]|uniref:hypothetical protein n=1 Tax=Streptomyces sanglieri TaxID=193460 RepID=UPI003525FC15